MTPLSNMPQQRTEHWPLLSGGQCALGFDRCWMTSTSSRSRVDFALFCTLSPHESANPTYCQMHTEVSVAGHNFTHRNCVWTSLFNCENLFCWWWFKRGPAGWKPYYGQFSYFHIVFYTCEIVFLHVCVFFFFFVEKGEPRSAGGGQT